MNDITPKEANEILSHYTDLGYGVVIEGEDTSKIKQALSLASKMLANGTPYNPSGDCISRSALKEAVKNRFDNSEYFPFHFLALIDNAPTVEITEKQAINKLYETGWLIEMSEAYDDLLKKMGECRTCRHRDPEDKKCDCGGLERQGCPFPVSDDYFCKFYEKGGAE